MFNILAKHHRSNKNQVNRLTKVQLENNMSVCVCFVKQFRALILAFTILCIDANNRLLKKSDIFSRWSRSNPDSRLICSTTVTDTDKHDTDADAVFAPL